LIGRDAELGVLRDALSEVVGGATRTVLLSGEAGIGKTRLLHEFFRLTPAEAVVAFGQSVDLGEDVPPYVPTIAATRALAAAVGPEAVRAAAGPGLRALGVLLPEFGTGENEITSGDHFFGAFTSLLEGLSAERPIVLVIEDLHWCDEASITLLRFLVRVLEDARVLFVFTFRSDEVRRGSALHSWLPELGRLRRVDHVELERLPIGAVRELMTAITGRTPSAADTSDVFERSEGVPFFVEELVSCTGEVVASSYPATLRELLLARYDRVTESTQRVLRLLAAGGCCVEHTLLEAVYPGDAAEIDDAAREAMDAGIVLVDGTSFAFRHALVRDAIHDQLLPGERVRFHTQYALALEGRARADTELSDVVEISHHWMVAHDLPRAFSSSLAAAERARASYAFGTAARMLERALELWEMVPDAESIAGHSHAEALLTAAGLHRNAGESERAIDLIDEALATPEAVAPELRAAMLRGKASYLANIGQTGSVPLLEEALRVLGDAPPSAIRANVLGELAARLMLDQRHDEAIRTADAAFLEAQSVDAEERMSVAANIRGMGRIGMGDIEAGLADLQLAGELAGEHESARLRYRLNLSDALNRLGRFDDAIRVAEEGAERARLRGLERTTGVVLMSNVIAPLFATGQSERAGALLDLALDLDAPLGFSSHLQLLKLQSVLRDGDVSRAEQLLKGWLPGLTRQRRIDAHVRARLAAISAEIALEAGDPLAAWRQVEWFIGPNRRAEPSLDVPVYIVVAQVLVSLAAHGLTSAAGESEVDIDAARRRLEGMVAECAAWPAAGPGLALIAAELSELDDLAADSRVHRWQRAVEAAALPVADAYLTPYTQFRLAEALAAAGERPAALEMAEAAATRARDIRMGLVARKVQDFVRRLGAGSAQRGDPELGSLTDRERQVLTLVAQGLSNRQVAERLYISPKTASVHVSNILRKVGASSRTEAAFVLRRYASVTTVPD
jgi:DNA-binding NarL/FixJ family response regulator